MLKRAAMLAMFLTGELLLVVGSTGIMTLVGAAMVAVGLSIEVRAWRQLAHAPGSKSNHDARA